MFSCRKAESSFGAARDQRLVPLRADSLCVLLLPFPGGHFWYRRASCDCAHDLDVFDFPLVHGVRIVCQRDEVRQPAALGGSRACSMRRNTHPLFFLPTDPFLSSASSSWC